MIDKTMCEVLWRAISDFYVNLRVEVGEIPTGNFSDVFFLSWTIMKDACKRNLCYIYSFVWFWNIVDHWFKQENREKGENFICEFYS